MFVNELKIVMVNLKNVRGVTQNG